ncbi:hypothetical protein Pmar_PMAR003265 [Perkinsus marinus ATCC 50983]|uniref:Chitinase n=1 Tax=Perkinsus marinus (strain ATCC 50983 / TXsc) TaxID=423536 RepID=C5L5P8_PERM5|nr:hypothetical protein Pmar_PMAR003265 [Perkinsus marinus ATCC 50983]EER07945.1 hypothetical protein Pmar_PMAR003265 [Perkinsus marinus ATCC 50983]|eukprot:XP_002776129.1 hypothetical protein Pmar_PMAR003265 [Perkinsus marinus ATCC 50983]
MRYILLLVIVVVAAYFSEAGRLDCPPSSETKNMATYSWRQAYWTGQDTTFIDFFKSDVSKDYNRGDVYLNVADASNVGKIIHPERLAELIANFRKVSGNSARFYLFYAQGGGDDKKWAPDFVRVFKEFILKYGNPDMGSLGISFHVKLDLATWYKIFDAFDALKTDPQFKPYNIALDVTMNYYNTDRKLVDQIMFRADHVTLLTFANTSPRLINFFVVFLTKICPNCNNNYYPNYKAKITFLAEGDCNSGACSKTSMCAYYSDRLDNPNGGILYAYNQLSTALDYVRDHVLSKDKFDYFFEAGGTHIGLNFFSWVMCYYGSESWHQIGLQKCISDYQSASQICRQG